MGLDMYMEKRVRLYKIQDKEWKKDIRLFSDDQPKVFKGLESPWLSFEVGYWRKANQIHHWFVENVQGGEDDCKEYRVTYEQLRQLYDLCSQILKEPNEKKRVKLAKDLLPTQEGFFFGSYDYDSAYFQDLQDTVEILENLFNEEDAEEADYVYSSSW